MITGLDLTATIDFQLPTDKKNPTIWKLGLVPSNLFAKIIQSGRTNPVDSAYEILKVGLRGWDNFNVEFKQEEQVLHGEKVLVIPLETLGKIPVGAINALNEQIIAIQDLTEGEIKNSKRQSAS